MKRQLILGVLTITIFSILTGCGEDSNPTASLETNIDKSWLLGNWFEVKFEYNFMDGTELEKGTEYYNESSTKSYSRFTQNNAYWYNIDGAKVQVDTMSYSVEAKLFRKNERKVKVKRKNAQEKGAHLPLVWRKRVPSRHLEHG